MGGFANYQGDLQSKRFTMDQSNAVFGMGVKYDLSSHFALRSGINYGSLSASDKLNKASLQARNLSFRTRLLEFNLLAEYTLFDLEERRVSPYAFAGLALYRFNPYANDTLGNKIYLQPLSTEGQGLSQYPDIKEYGLTQFAVPFGIGLKLRVSENAVLGLEGGMRKLFTDYLDDVSGRYIDQNVLAAERGPKAVEMAYRGGELKDAAASYPPAGTLRGSSKFKDWYYFSGITLTIGINTGSGFGTGSGRKGNMGCPTGVL